MSSKKLMKFTPDPKEAVYTIITGSKGAELLKQALIDEATRNRSVDDGAGVPGVNQGQIQGDSKV